MRDQLKTWEDMGYGHLPICIAKTQYSFTTNPDQRGAPTGFTIPVREVRLSNKGAQDLYRRFGFAPEAHFTEAQASEEKARQLFEEWSPHWDLARPVLLGRPDNLEWLPINSIAVSPLSASTTSKPRRSKRRVRRVRLSLTSSTISKR